MTPPIKMTNIGIFVDYLMWEIESKITERKMSSDPYEQMTIDREKKLLEKTLVKYKELIINQ